MRVIAVVLVLVLAGSSPLVAAGSGDHSPIVSSAERAVAREIAKMEQVDNNNGEGGNPFLKPSVLMIGAGLAVALAAAKVPKLKTQTQEYDRCAQQNGVATGPSNFSSGCSSFTKTNKPLQRFGFGTAAAGLALLSISSVMMKDFTFSAGPAGGFRVTKTSTF